MKIPCASRCCLSLDKSDYQQAGSFLGLCDLLITCRNHSDYAKTSCAVCSPGVLLKPASPGFSLQSA